jgi:hypothetical protein
LILYFLSQIAIFSSLGLPSYRRSLHPSKEKSRTSKHEISLLFIFLWVISALLDPDPATAATQINADPDPKPWFIFIPCTE